jgi:hypothetical protein
MLSQQNYVPEHTYIFPQKSELSEFYLSLKRASLGRPVQVTEKNFVLITVPNLKNWTLVPQKNRT